MGEVEILEVDLFFQGDDCAPAVSAEEIYIPVVNWEAESASADCPQPTASVDFDNFDFNISLQEPAGDSYTPRPVPTNLTIFFLNEPAGEFYTPRPVPANCVTIVGTVPSSDSPPVEATGCLPPCPPSPF